MSSTSLFKWMGLGQQSGKPAIDNDTIDEGERYFGLENFGNTCYSNSVVQALYYCKPFRQCVLNYPQVNQPQQPLYTPQSTHPNSPMVSNTQLHGHNNASYFTSSSNASATGTNSPSLANGSTDRLTNGTSTPNRETSTGTTATIAGKTLSRGSISGLNSVNGSSHGSNATTSSTTAIEKDQNNVNLAPGMEDTLFSSLKDLFWKISTNKKKTGVIAPVNFINKVKKENELFRSSMHQDAHEFLNYTLNTIAEDVQKYQKRIAEEKETKQSSIHSEASQTDTNTSTDTTTSNPRSTWVHQLFEGIFSNETKCLSCETVTSRDECFMDLSIDVEMNSSITSCLRQFSASETLCHKNKYFCDACSGLQEAERRMKIKKLPNILALHLKRFKYQEQLQKYIKLTYRVVFPFELRLFNTSDDTEDADRMYELWGIVVHIGSGPHHGHYVAIIKSNGQWMLFDDDVVTQIQEEDIQKYFSDLPGSGSGYVLFYQAVDLNMDTINIGLDQPLSKLDEYATGRPSAVPSINPLSPIRLDNEHFDLQSPTNTHFLHSELPTPDTVSPIPTPTHTPPILHQPQQPEEKKTRWGLRSKIKRDKK